ncbi:hypothetical protein ACIQMV_24610 [Streptomyces sp. NPDC091412]|uniref:hypothetical protein n=1 Tax=Streptomyces sp. NPDC091412 TaxID=3366002 RepID=UPI00381AB28F
MLGRGAVAAAAVVVFTAGLLGLLGCSFEGGGAAEPPTAASTGGVTTSAASPLPNSTTGSASPSAPGSPSPVPVTGPDQKLVSMTVTGGFAGVHQLVILRGDGTVYASEKGQPAVRHTSAAQFTELRTLLGDPALADVPDFTMDMGAADMLQYTLQFNGRTVMTDRSGDEPALDRLIDALSPWLSKK